MPRIMSREDIRQAAHDASRDADPLVARYGREAAELLRMGMTRQAERRLQAVTQRRRTISILGV